MKKTTTENLEVKVVYRNRNVDVFKNVKEPKLTQDALLIEHGESEIKRAIPVDGIKRYYVTKTIKDEYVLVDD